MRVCSKIFLLVDSQTHWWKWQCSIKYFFLICIFLFQWKTWFINGVKFISNMHFTHILYTILHHFSIIQLNNISINLSINLCTLWIAKWLLNVTGLVFFYSWQLYFSCTASLLALGVDELLTLEKRSTVFMYIYQYFAIFCVTCMKVGLQFLKIEIYCVLLCNLWNFLCIFSL